MEAQRHDEERYQDKLIVKVEQGLLRGALKQNSYGTFYSSFTGIPYAAPPVGELRFRDPQPPACWYGIRDVKNNIDNCIQIATYIKDVFIGREDCLYLNIYTSYHAVVEKSKAVMVWIHGGGFLIGSGNYSEAQPDYFMERDIILVSFNYRLGALGFLNLRHNTASGNQGLKDQVIALTWVKKNIAAFGGDPNNITVFGSDTGAVSAHLLTLSPLSKGLIHKAILQGGIASMKWMVTESRPEENAFKLASLLGNNSKDPEEVVAFLREKSAAEILKAQYKILTSHVERGMGKLIFGPTIDQFATNSFLPCSVDELISTGNQIPIIVGYNSNIHFGIPKGTKTHYIRKKELDTIYTNLPFYLETLNPDDKEEIRWVTGLLQFISLNFHKYQIPLISNIREFLNNVHFDIPIKGFVNHQREKTESPIYLYEFSYVGKQKFSVSNSWRHDEHITGKVQPFNGDELAYLFYMPQYMVEDYEAPRVRTDDFRILHILTSMWAAFAKKGNPTPYIHMYMSTKWLPVSKDIFYYLHIDKEARLLSHKPRD